MKESSIDDPALPDEKNTKETVDAEGWIHTGDVGEIDEFGRFKVIDRVKVLFPTDTLTSSRIAHDPLS